MPVHRFTTSCLVVAWITAACLSLAPSAQGQGTTPPAARAIELERAFPALRFREPTDLTHVPDGTNRLVVVERAGRITIVANRQDVRSAKTFLDITRKVESGYVEQGLLGVAFHPDYRRNRLFYVNYTASNPQRTVIARYRAHPTDPDRADPESETVVLSFRQPYANHNGGQLAFGPDGYLYIGTGDGGSGGDPHGNGQSRKTLLGKWLRLDVDRTSGDRPYAIPRDNPYVGNRQGWRPEIYAYGLRNLWRFSYDPETRRWWGADVGQNRLEEIDLLEKGKNYGWAIMEGDACFRRESCDRRGLTLPVAQYGHDQGQSVTGGFVYRGRRVPSLVGAYVYADFVSGRFWALRHDGKKVTENRLLMDTEINPSTFGIDQNRELYVASFDGRLYRFR